jgi:hypothetical protein
LRDFYCRTGCCGLQLERFRVLSACDLNGLRVVALGRGEVGCRRRRQCVAEERQEACLVLPEPVSSDERERLLARRARGADVALA